MTAEPRRCAVLGSPIAHSLSPELHRAAYAALSLDWTYERVEVTAAGLAAFVAGLGREWRGLSLTMPLKEAVLDLGDADPVARAARAGNTLIFDEDRPRVYNTDVAGLVWAVRRASNSRLDHVLLVGAGATARSALLACAELGATLISLVARNATRARELVELGASLDVAVSYEGWTSDLPAWDTVISTVPAGVADELVDEIVPHASVVVDAVYAPWPTRLAESAKTWGAQVVSGRDLLIGQALRQIELMTGRTVDADILYQALPR